MRGNIDLKKLESFLRRTRLEAPINEAHKNRLQHQLFSELSKRPLFRSRFVLTGSVAILAVVVLLVLFRPSQAVVGTVEWQTANAQQKTVLSGTRYRTRNDTAVVTLDENSRLRFLPGSVFSVLSPSTDRVSEDAVVFLERGTLEASVTELLQHSVIVKTPDVEVRVIGTRFIVSVTEEIIPEPTIGSPSGEGP